MMGPGMGPLMPQMWAMGLTDEQRDKLENIANETRKAHWDLMGQRMDQATELRRLYAADRPDAKAIGKVYGKMFDLKRQMIEASIEGRNRGYDVLTDEQRARLKPPRRPMRPAQQ